MLVTGISIERSQDAACYYKCDIGKISQINFCAFVLLLVIPPTRPMTVKNLEIQTNAHSMAFRL